MPAVATASEDSDSFLRSQTLVLCEILLPVEVAFECLVALGKSQEPVHLVDTQTTGQADSRPDVPRRQLGRQQCRSLAAQLQSLKKLFVECADYLRLQGSPSSDSDAYDMRPKSLVDIEASVSSLHSDMQQLSLYEEAMNVTYMRLLHQINAVECLDRALWPATQRWQVSSSAVRSAQTEGGDADKLLRSGHSADSDTDDTEAGSLPCTLGAVAAHKAYALRLKIWRRYRLAALYTDVTVNEIRDLRDSPVVPHNVFLIVSVSQQQRTDVERMCRLLGAEVLELPAGQEARRELLDNAKERLAEMRSVFLEGVDHRRRMTLDGWTKWKRWSMQVSLVQSVYDAMDRLRLDSTGRYYFGQLWCPNSSVEAVQCCLSEGSSRSSGLKASVRLQELWPGRPPTRVAESSLTEAARHVVHQFGVPRYKEIDPTPLTCVTLPFLFGVMFGDCGHGLLLLAASLLLFGHCRLPSGAASLRWLRWPLLACGAFGTYCGLVYNECFGQTLSFGRLSQLSAAGLNFTWAARHKGDVVLQPFRMAGGQRLLADPVWSLAVNQVKFFNSARMKLSILFGFLHLTLGLGLQICNDCFFGNWPNLWLSSLPKLLFFTGLLGYAAFLIVLKWLTASSADAACAPALLPMLISMYRFHYPARPCYLAEFYSGQKLVQYVVVALVVASAFTVAFGLPLRQALLHWRRQHGGSDSNSASQQLDLLGHSIQCFEFLLSSVSHSASYLRLWAIGLAHEELSGIAWPLLLKPQARVSGVVRQPTLSMLAGGCALAGGFLLWAVVTAGVLVGLEGTTALLHSLRLHWIEFQSKFYSGDGYEFEEFSLKKVEQRVKAAHARFLEFNE